MDPETPAARVGRQWEGCLLTSIPGLQHCILPDVLLAATTGSRSGTLKAARFPLPPWPRPSVKACLDPAHLLLPPCSPPPPAVKCLFEAFDKLRTHEEMLARTDKVVLSMPPGRYGRLRPPNLS